MASKGNGLLKLGIVAAAVVAAVAVFVGGALIGAIFMQNFEIVPKGQVAQMAKEMNEDGRLDEILAQTGLGDVLEQQGLDQGTLDAILQDEEMVEKMLRGEEVDATALLENAMKQSGAAGEFQVQDKLSQNTAAAAKQQQDSGPFTFKFSEGETLAYNFDASIEGEGMELLGSSPISMNFDSGFTLHTEKVDEEGNGYLEMNFDKTMLDGDFMGSDFLMEQGPEGSRVRSNGNPLLDTFAGMGGIGGIPQMEFFNETIKMKVGPNGVVQSMEGSEGAAGMIKSLPIFSDMEYPTGELQEGAQWESRIVMPVPGMGTPVEAKVMNTFTGYQQVGERLCAVIDQEVIAVDENNMLNMPQSALGSAMGFGVPKMDLNGNNKIYFDVNNGQMVHTDMDMKLDLDIGSALGGAGTALQQLGQGLGDILGDLPEFQDMVPKKQGGGGDGNMLDMSVDIKGTVSLQDSEAAAAAKAETAEPQDADAKAEDVVTPPAIEEDKPARELIGPAADTSQADRVAEAFESLRRNFPELSLN